MIASVLAELVLLLVLGVMPKCVQAEKRSTIWSAPPTAALWLSPEPVIGKKCSFRGFRSDRSQSAREGSDLVGKAAPSWNDPQWVQGGPLTLERLRGRLVLLRWWTGPECPYCEASAPYLNEWHEKYASRGLVVIGFYHHKSRRPLALDSVNQLAARFGFRFPIAIDPDWRTLRRWWLDGADRGYTSVSFLLDRNGIIRYVHRGGSYSRENAAAIEAQIRKLLEHPTAGRKTRP